MERARCTARSDFPTPVVPITATTFRGLELELELELEPEAMALVVCVIVDMARFQTFIYLSATLVSSR